MFCLNRNLTKLFLEKLRSGGIEPGRLASMSSAERRAFFSEFLGESNGVAVNTLFESKLLLKDQQRGMISWAKQVTGLKPEARRDIIARVNKMTEVLNPKDQQAFLEDLARHRLGMTVTLEEAGTISSLAQKVRSAREKLEQGGDRMEYGRARVEFANYVNDLKASAASLTVKEALTSPGRAISNVAGVSKSLKATLDNSGIFRQGWKVLWTHPGIWFRNSVKSFRDIARTFGGKAVADEILADVWSRPNALNGTYTKMRLALGTLEEAFPTKSPGKVPVLGRVYRASENAYNGIQFRNRADLADLYAKIADEAGVNLSDAAQAQSIGALVNSLTGRANLGRFEGQGAVTLNNIFFSPRFVKSQIDTFTHPFGFDLLGQTVTPFVRKQSAINLLKVISGTAAVLVTANALRPRSVEKDPTSADFGKVKIGNTRFDATGGMSALATLAARLITNKSKSSTTGNVTEINTGKYGSRDSLDVVYDFAENKLSPAASFVKSLLIKKDRRGDMPSVRGALTDLFVPIPVTTYQELKKDPDAADVLLSMIADALGISTNTYK